jgi:FixJ family two-component response regulator
VPPLAWDDDTIDDPAAYPRTSPPIGPTCTDCAHPSCEVIRPQLDEVAVEEAARGRAVYLTPAERQVAVERLTARGQSAREIADLLNTSPRTVQRKRAAA